MANVTLTIEGDTGEVVAMIREMAGRANADGAPEPPTVVASVAAPSLASPDLAASALAADAPDAEMDTAPAAVETEPAAPPPPPAPPAIPEAEWNIRYFNAFWNHLSDRAQEAMRRVSRSPNYRQRRVQLMHTLDLSQRELSGSLSSQGHSLNRLKRGPRGVALPRPLNYDKDDDMYVLDANFANAMRETGIN